MNRIRDGSLTGREAHTLAHGQVKTRRMERRFESDGVIIQREKRHMGHQQAKQSARIFRKKHNGRNRCPLR